MDEDRQMLEELIFRDLVELCRSGDFSDAFLRKLWLSRLTLVREAAAEAPKGQRGLRAPLFRVLKHTATNNMDPSKALVVSKLLSLDKTVAPVRLQPAPNRYRAVGELFPTTRNGPLQERTIQRTRRDPCLRALAGSLTSRELAARWAVEVQQERETLPATTEGMLRSLYQHRHDKTGMFVQSLSDTPDASISVEDEAVELSVGWHDRWWRFRFERLVEEDKPVNEENWPRYAGMDGRYRYSAMYGNWVGAEKEVRSWTANLGGYAD